MSGWKVWEYDEGFFAVVPMGDLKDHDTDTFWNTGESACWCKPTLEDCAHVHHSADGREAFERGERKPS